MPEEDERRVELFCPGCNIFVEAKVRASANGSESVKHATISGPEDSLWEIVEYSVAFCPRCESPFLIESEYYEIPGEHVSLQSEKVLYPIERTLSHEGAPETVLRSYQQAMRSYRAGLYEPCAIMCRKSIEAICNDLNASGGNLKKRLEDLKKREIIDPKLFKWADQLRIIGNDAAHDMEIDIDQDDANDALDFTEAIVLNVYTLNARFEV